MNHHPRPGAFVPIVDIDGFSRYPQRRSVIVAAVDRALAENGFMYVVGHGIEPVLIERAFAAMRAFFAQPGALKNSYAYADLDANFGYQSLKQENLDPHGMPDLKESFTMRDALKRADQAAIWPGGDFRDVALKLYTVGLRAALRIMAVLETCLGLPADFFARRHHGENVALRFLHYPADLTTCSGEQFGAGAHTDYGSITLLLQDGVGGLELLGQDGQWRSAPPVPEAAVINTGDLMERWTNGRFRSTVHRVRLIAGARDRYSIALFVDPDTAVEVECFASCVTTERPLRYARTTAGEHIRQKIAATHRLVK